MTDAATDRRYGFTFGSGYNLRDNYAWVTAPNEYMARVMFIAAREEAGRLSQSGRRWSSCYSEARMLEVAERYHLTEVPLDTPIDWADPANPHD